MFMRTVLRAVVRFGLVVSVVFSGATFSADDAEARRGGKVRSYKSHAKQHDRAKQHDDGETSRKSNHGDDDSAGSSGGSYVPGVRVRRREASRDSSGAATDTGPNATRRGRAAIPVAGSEIATDKDIDVPGCGTGMICTVCLAGCEGAINSIVDAEPMTPRPKPQE